MRAMPHESHNVPLHRGQVWRHKRTGTRAIVNTWVGGDVQVLNEERTFLRWLSIRGFLRDYEQEPAT